MEEESETNQRSFNVMNQTSFNFLALIRKFSLLSNSKARIFFSNQTFEQKVQTIASYFYSLFGYFH